MDYNILPKYVLRTPLLSLNFYNLLTKDSRLSEDKLKDIFDIPEIKEALFLASPEFFSTLDQWRNGKIDKKKEKKIIYTFLKYLSRMSSRCTPFGLFAGCEVGKLDKKTSIILETEINNNVRQTRLDMNFLVALAKDLTLRENIKKQLLFFPNTSIYQVESQLRYVEYSYINGKRKHHTVAVENSEPLRLVLDYARKGATINELSLLLLDDDIHLDEATDFIEELVSSQLLISELEPSVSGSEFLEQIIKILSKLKGVDDILDILNSVAIKLRELDKVFGNSSEVYISISKELEQLGTQFDLKFLFQTDIIKKTIENKLNIDIVNSVKKGLSFLNKITPLNKNTEIEEFKKAFYQRFEDQEVPLALALDVELGVGFKQNNSDFEINPLIDDLILPVSSSSDRTINFSKFDEIIHKKFLTSVKNNDYVIKFSDDDVKDFEEDWTRIVDTFSVMIELLNVEDTQKIKLDGFGGSSAGNLLGRFCFLDKEIDEQVKSISKYEQNLNKDKIVAEIVHLPESRVGNVLLRTRLREYEIPYIAKSLLPDKNIIDINDIYISVKGDRLILKSKKFNKEILPRLTNAHNFKFNALPIYEFLCSYQTYLKKSSLWFNISFFNNQQFIPRIEYDNCILSEASWNLKKDDIKPLIEVYDNDDVLKEKVKNFKNELRIPKLVTLVEGDNELLINLDNIISVKMFLEIIKNKFNFIIKEYLFSEEQIVKNSRGEGFSNQAILSFYKNNINEATY